MLLALMDDSSTDTRLRRRRCSNNVLAARHLPQRLGYVFPRHVFQGQPQEPQHELSFTQYAINEATKSSGLEIDFRYLAGPCRIMARAGPDGLHRP